MTEKPFKCYDTIVTYRHWPRRPLADPGPGHPRRFQQRHSHRLTFVSWKTFTPEAQGDMSQYSRTSLLVLLLVRAGCVGSRGLSSGVRGLRSRGVSTLGSG